MTIRQRYASLGAIGGAIFGAASMIMPTILRPHLRMAPSVLVFVCIGTAIMGGIFGIMTANEKNARP